MRPDDARRLLDWRPIPYGEAHEDVGYLVTGCKRQEADGEDEKAADGPRGDLTSISIRRID